MFESNNENELILDNKGSDIKTVKKRATGKFLSNFLALRLAKLHENDENDYWFNRYYKTVLCSGLLAEVGGRFVSSFCKYKICVVCSRIRTAQLIHAYRDAVEELQDKKFVTLTVKNVNAHELSGKLREMVQSFQKAKDNLRKQKINLRGTRNMEVTYNYKENTYHPHFHLIIENKYHAECLISEWLRLNAGVEPYLQNFREFGLREDDFLECFKYVNKLISNSKTVYRTDELATFKEIDERLYISAIDIINQAVSGVGNDNRFRTFQAFGLKRKKENEREISEIAESDYVMNFWKYQFDFENKLFDWKNTRVDNFLTNFEPSSRLIDLVENKTFDYNLKNI